MEYIVKHVAGSVMYDLATAESDVDIKGVYVNRDPEVLFGLKTDNGKVTTSEEEDVALFELRRFFQLLRKTNTNALESLFFRYKHIIDDSETYRTIRQNRSEFIDSKQLLRSLAGYMHGEYRLTIGERSGKLGGKRKEALEKYGYSYKNLVHMKRLLNAAKKFFKDGDFQTSLYGDPIRDELLDMKLHPEKISADKAKEIGQNCIEEMNNIKDTIKSEFNSELACDIMKSVYL